MRTGIRLVGKYGCDRAPKEHNDVNSHRAISILKYWYQAQFRNQVYSGHNMTEIIFVVHEPPEGGYSAEALGHSIFTVADNLQELNEMVRDAVVCHFDEPDRPKIIRLHFVRDEVIAV
jgi:hypothetical protein